MLFWIFGTVLLALAIGLAIGASFQKKRHLLMATTETSTAAELTSMAQAVAGDIGAGSFHQLAEVKGTIRCDQPLTSELSQVPCVYYSMKVTREYEETTWETDSNQNRTQRVRRGSESVARNTRSCPFEVEDGTGRVQVDPTGASVIAEKACDRFEPGEMVSPSQSFFERALQLGTAGGRRTLGYRKEEDIIPLGRPIYVIGEASDTSGRIVIRKPARGTFLVSTRSEEQLTHAARRTSRWLMIGTLVSAAAGVGLLLGGLLG
jgi:hypothetical protein